MQIVSCKLLHATCQRLCYNCSKTTVRDCQLAVVRGEFCQQVADTTHWVDIIDWTVRCDWLQVAEC